MSNQPLNSPNVSVPAVPVPVIIALVIVAVTGFSCFAYVLVNGNVNAAMLIYLNRSHRFAERGNAEAQLVLANYYSNGIAVPPNHEEAIKWFRKAAEQMLYLRRRTHHQQESFVRTIQIFQ
jgi:hypothetical protein